MRVRYVGVRGSKVDIWIFWVSNSTSLAVRIISSSKISKIASYPSIDAKGNNDTSQDEITHQATAICT